MINIKRNSNLKTNLTKFHQICKDIKSIKIQGATNVAKAGIEAYSLIPTEKSKETLLKLRPTEPALANAINSLKTNTKQQVLTHFENSQKIINKEVLRLIKNNSIIYTHCHSGSVTKALIEAKKHKKNFEVYNTETRPLYQGRITSKELTKANIKVTQFVDSAFHEAIPKADLILIGADAILEDGVINKVGSATVAELAQLHKVPLYIVSDSWKFSPKNVKIEERDFHEVWKNAPKKLKIENPAFEKIEKNNVTAIISELGILRYDDFIKKVKNEK